MLILKIIGIALLSVLAFFLLGFLFLFICGLFVNPKKEYDAHSKFFRCILNISTAIGIKLLRINIQVSGMEQLPTDTKNILFVGNHRSNYDPIVTWHILRRWQPAFISKPSNFHIPFFGRIIRKCCFMAIDRENPRNAIKTIQKAARLLQQGEVSVGVYPEGTRSKSGELLPFHNGVFKIAQKADAPIAVISLRGTEEIHKRTPFRRTIVHFDVLEVLSAEYVKGAKTDAIGERVRNLLQK